MYLVTFYSAKDHKNAKWCAVIVSMIIFLIAGYSYSSGLRDCSAMMLFIGFLSLIDCFFISNTADFTPSPQLGATMHKMPLASTRFPPKRGPVSIDEQE